MVNQRKVMSNCILSEFIADGDKVKIIEVCFLRFRNRPIWAMEK